MGNLATLRTRIILFCFAGDRIECLHIGKPISRSCQICGEDTHKLAHLLKNRRSGRTIVTCPRCTRLCGEATLEPIEYPEAYAKVVARVNEKWPGSAVVAPAEPKGLKNWSDDDFEEDFEEDRPSGLFEEWSHGDGFDWAPEGLGPGEMDWDSYDYESE